MSTIIDITDLVAKAKATFVLWATAALYGWAVTAVPALANPIAGTIIKELISSAMTFLANTAIMGAFILDTMIRKHGEAQSYIDAVNRKNSLPENVTDAEFEKAEQDEIAAFNDLVRLDR